jgi:hypothetical protein
MGPCGIVDFTPLESTACVVITDYIMATSHFFTSTIGFFLLGLLLDEYNLRMNIQEQERIERRIKDEEWPTDGVEEVEVDYSDRAPLLHNSSPIQIPVSPKTPRPQVTKPNQKA